MSSQGRSLGQAVAVVVGLAYAVGGVIGFVITGFDGFFASGNYHSLFGFVLNPFHDLIHLAVGAILLLAATRDTAITEGVMLGVGGVYIVATITGFIYAHIPVIAITTAGNPDNYLHLISGGTLVLASLMSAGATGRSRRSAY